VKPEHEVEISGHDTSKVVSVIGVPHELPEETMLKSLSFLGKVLASKICMHAEHPNIENGNRLYRMEIKREIPSTLLFGNKYVWVRYQGQTKTCLKCGSSDHIAADGHGCKAIKCRRCGELGHLDKGCKGEIVCNVCNEKGDTYAQCKKVFPGKVVVSHTWAQIVGMGPPKPVQTVNNPEQPTQPIEMEISTGMEPQRAARRRCGELGHQDEDCKGRLCAMYVKKRGTHTPSAKKSSR